MAAALLMMNMHGAVCASDRDRTIFRYSEKIPFAIQSNLEMSTPYHRKITPSLTTGRYFILRTIKKRL